VLCFWAAKRHSIYFYHCKLGARETIKLIGNFLIQRDTLCVPTSSLRLAMLFHSIRVWLVLFHYQCARANNQFVGGGGGLSNVSLEIVWRKKRSKEQCDRIEDSQSTASPPIGKHLNEEFLSRFTFHRVFLRPHEENFFFSSSLFTFFFKATRVTRATVRRVPGSLSQRAQKGNENKLNSFTVLLLEQLYQWREEEVLRPRDELAVSVRVFFHFGLVLGAIAVVFLDFRHQVRRCRVLRAFLLRCRRRIRVVY
jgi:hypothetical protein